MEISFFPPMIKLTLLSEGLVWAVHGGGLKIRWSPKNIEGNSSMVEEKGANMTSLKSTEEYITTLPMPISVVSSNNLPFSLVLLALLEVIGSLLHSRLFSG